MCALVEIGAAREQLGCNVMVCGNITHSGAGLLAPPVLITYRCRYEDNSGFGQAGGVMLPKSCTLVVARAVWAS